MNVETAEWRRDAIGGDRDETIIVVQRRRRNLIIAVVAGLAIVLALVLAMMMRGGGDEPEAASKAAAAGPAAGGARNQAMPSVTVIVPGRQQVARTITASGTLAARRDMPVGIAGEGGMVASVLVDAGSWVRQGQTMATIERSVQSQEAQQLAASIEVARADARLAQQELDRAQALVSRGFVSKADVERRTAARDAANARVKVAQAQLGASRARIGRLDIRAPAAGLVLERRVEPGQVVGAGSGALFRIAMGGNMEMVANVPQQDLAALKVGLPVEVRPVGSPNTFKGQIWQIAPLIDPQSRLGRVRIAVPYAPDMRPGGFAEARIVAGASTLPLIPQSAVQSDQGGSYVYVIDANNQVVRRDVEVGSVTNEGVSIAAGLSGQERIVLSAAPFLNPGQKVRPNRAVSP